MSLMWVEAMSADAVPAGTEQASSVARARTTRLRTKVADASCKDTTKDAPKKAKAISAREKNNSKLRSAIHRLMKAGKTADSTEVRALELKFEYSDKRQATNMRSPVKAVHAAISENASLEEDVADRQDKGDDSMEEVRQGIVESSLILRRPTTLS